MDEEEERYLESSAFSKELVENVRKCWSEHELLTWLVENKPGELRFGREHWLEMLDLENFMEGLCLKLTIHGYEDRANRFKYLWKVLKKQWGNKEDTFKIMVQFLMSMAIRPTGVIHLDLSDAKYSSDLEDDPPEEDVDSEQQKLLLLEILGDIRDETEPYSSGDSLSSWTESEDEDISARSGNSLPPVTKPIRTSSSFGEFSDIVAEKPPEDPELKKREAEQFWRNERSRAEASLQSVRRFDTVLLQSQPVISSLVVLHSRFGEFWEWKHSRQLTISSEPVKISFVDDVVREVLWQFVLSNPSKSPVFTPDWKPHPHLMVASLSKSMFNQAISKLGETLEKLETLRKFSACTTAAASGNNPPSKVYLIYCSALNEISTYINQQISLIERNLKRLPKPDPDPLESPGCTTFLQLIKLTREISEIVKLLYQVHVHAVSTPEEDSSGAGDFTELPWLLSVRLLSCVEAFLTVETRPKYHGVMLFFYSKLYHCLLQEILDCVKTLKWKEGYSLFTRDSAVFLNDLNFWSDIIKIKSFSTFSEGRLQALKNFLRKVLNILKTCEVFNQLEEDFSQILAGDGSKISVETIIIQFLQHTMPSLEIPSVSQAIKEEKIDYFKHFAALGLGNSPVASCFKFLVEKPKKTVKAEPFKFANFLSISAVPTQSHDVILDAVLTSHFTPFYSSAKLEIEKIFQDYKLLERLQIFQEIILAVREDFARGIILIAAKSTSSEYKFEDALSRNGKYQQLLNLSYPPELRGDIFSVDLRLDPNSDMNCTFDVTPKFPLNLIVSPQSVAGYLFIGRQLYRIRKSVWNVTSLSIKSCCTEASNNSVHSKRILVFRHLLLNFCSSFQSFFMLKLFSTDFSQFIRKSSVGGEENETDLDLLRRVHENYLDMIQTKMLRDPLIENIIIPKMTTMSETLRIHWASGISQRNMRVLEDTLKKCWQVVNGFESNSKYGEDFNQLSWHFSRPPTYLANP